MSARLVATGLEYDTGEPLVEPVDEDEFADRLAASLGDNIDGLRSAVAAGTKGVGIREELEREPAVDPGDPRSAGWTYLVDGDDPDRSEIARVLRPLAEHRGMAEPDRPLVLRPDDDWFDWLTDEYAALPVARRPGYVLLVGGPDRLPFGFQAFLDTSASVGRVAFERLEDLRAYVDKVLRLERAERPAAGPEAVVFAPDAGGRDATYYSRRWMAEPLAEVAAAGGRYRVTAVAGDEATKAHLLETLGATAPALVYTASHGMADPRGTPERQRRVNGAICCQRRWDTEVADWLFTAEDVPGDDEPFCEGAVVVQFACFGYGTPAESDFAHWKLGVPPVNTASDFVAALPRRLLAHPRGPVAFVGHVDLAWLHAFDDPDAPGAAERWHPRLAPFVTLVERLLALQPPGYAMADLNARYAQTSVVLTTMYDRIERGRLVLDEPARRRLASAFVTRSDAQNYLVLGDPAARLRVAAGGRR